MISDAVSSEYISSPPSPPGVRCKEPRRGIEFSSPVWLPDGLRLKNIETIISSHTLPLVEAMTVMVQACVRATAKHVPLDSALNYISDEYYKFKSVKACAEHLRTNLEIYR